jgi:ubiquinone/menaquinone biosynthesis C-methylase UbiE
LSNPRPHPFRALGALPAQAGFFLWAFTPFRPMAARELYGLLGGSTFTERGLYLNLGYWARARTIDEASEALVTRVAEAAGMGPADEVVDVGFGFADQDILWARRFAPRRITGLNVTPLHVKVGRERVRRLGLADRIDLRLGSATAMDLPDACCDVVTAVECAFHFDTRERFFAEALRVLRPGGRIVTADVIRQPPSAEGWRQRLQDATWEMFADRFAVPAANAVERPAYAAQLQVAGFEAVRVDSIRDQVFPGWHRALREDRALRRRLPLEGRLSYRPLLALDADTVYGALDYVLASARKPA